MFIIFNYCLSFLGVGEWKAKTNLSFLNSCFIYFGTRVMRLQKAFLWR